MSIQTVLQRTLCMFANVCMGLNVPVRFEPVHLIALSTLNVVCATVLLQVTILVPIKLLTIINQFRLLRKLGHLYMVAQNGFYCFQKTRLSNPSSYHLIN